MIEQNKITNHFDLASDNFDYIKTVLVPQWNRTSTVQFKLWFVGASDAEKVFSLVLNLASNLDTSKTLSILATDESSKELARARNGVFERKAIESVPVDLQKQFFSFGTGDIAKWVKVKDTIKNRVSFREHELKTPSLPSVQFDLIYLNQDLSQTNTLIKQQIFDKLYQAMPPDGFLILSKAESISGIHHKWTPVRDLIFKKSELWV